MPKADHRHDCEGGCGAYYVCSRRDGCDQDEWTCPECEQDARMAEFEQLMQQEMCDDDHC